MPPQTTLEGTVEGAYNPNSPSTSAQAYHTGTPLYDHNDMSHLKKIARDNPNREVVLDGRVFRLSGGKEGKEERFMELYRASDTQKAHIGYQSADGTRVGYKSVKQADVLRAYQREKDLNAVLGQYQSLISQAYQKKPKTEAANKELSSSAHLSLADLVNGKAEERIARARDYGTIGSDEATAASSVLSSYKKSLSEIYKGPIENIRNQGRAKKKRARVSDRVFSPSHYQPQKKESISKRYILSQRELTAGQQTIQEKLSYFPALERGAVHGFPRGAKPDGQLRPWKGQRPNPTLLSRYANIGRARDSTLEARHLPVGVKGGKYAHVGEVVRESTALRQSNLDALVAAGVVPAELVASSSLSQSPSYEVPSTSVQQSTPLGIPHFSVRTYDELVALRRSHRPSMLRGLGRSVNSFFGRIGSLLGYRSVETPISKEIQYAASSVEGVSPLQTVAARRGFGSKFEDKILYPALTFGLGAFMVGYLASKVAGYDPSEFFSRSRAQVAASASQSAGAPAPKKQTSSDPRYKTIALEQIAQFNDYISRKIGSLNGAGSYGWSLIGASISDADKVALESSQKQGTSTTGTLDDTVLLASAANQETLSPTVILPLIASPTVDQPVYHQEKQLGFNREGWQRKKRNWIKQMEKRKKGSQSRSRISVAHGAQIVEDTLDPTRGNIMYKYDDRVKPAFEAETTSYDKSDRLSYKLLQDLKKEREPNRLDRLRTKVESRQSKLGQVD